MLPVFFSGLRAEINTTINPRSVPSGGVRSARRTLGVSDLRALEDSLIRLRLPKEIELLGHHCHEPDLLPMAFERAHGRPLSRSQSRSVSSSELDTARPSAVGFVGPNSAVEGRATVGRHRIAKQSAISFVLPPVAEQTSNDRLSPHQKRRCPLSKQLLLRLAAPVHFSTVSTKPHSPRHFAGNCLKRRLNTRQLGMGVLVPCQGGAGELHGFLPFNGSSELTGNHQPCSPFRGPNVKLPHLDVVRLIPCTGISR
jgi:hypothetical protein